MNRRVVLISLLTFIIFFDNVYASNNVCYNNCGYKNYDDSRVSLDDNVVIASGNFNNYAVTFSPSMYCPNSWQASNYACFAGANGDDTSNIWKAPRFTSNVKTLTEKDYGFFLPIYVNDISNIKSQTLTSDNFTYTGQKYVIYYYLSSYNFWKTNGKWKNTAKSLSSSICTYNGVNYPVNSLYFSVSECDKIDFSSPLDKITKQLEYDKNKIEDINLVEYAYVNGNLSNDQTLSHEKNITVKTYKTYGLFSDYNCFNNYCLTDNSIDLMNKYGNKTTITFNNNTFNLSTDFFKKPENGYIRWNDSMIYNMFYFAFEITPKDKLPDEVCTIGNDSINSCESKNLLYNCDKMKIRTTSDDGTILAAYVNIQEAGRLTMTSYAGTNVKVLAGQGFPIGMSYVYNLTWKMSDIVCNGVDDKTCYEKLYDKLNKISFSNVRSNVLQDNLNTTGVREVTKFKENTDENLSSAGSWECNGQLDEHAEGDTSGGASIICQYKIKDAYINFDTGYITYKDKSSQNRFKNLGSYFYIPLNYSDTTFSWNVVSNNISLVKVRTIKDNYDFVSNNGWNINTKNNVDESGNDLSKCFVEVKKGSIGPPGAGTDDGINIVYRSVDTDISSDESTLDSNLKLYYLEEGTNWYNYFYNVNDDGSKSLNRSHISRIKTTFNNLHYSTETLTNSKIKTLLNSYDSESYTKWSNIDSNGISSFVKDSSYFKSINLGIGNVHCKWGEFNEETCDRYNS